MRLRILRLALFLVADAALLLLLWTAWMALRVGPLMPGPALGNTPRSLETLPAKDAKGPIRFAVVSDIEEGVETFREALARLAERRPDFVILNGDLAYRPTEEGFRYFEWQFRDCAYPGPFFCNPGNHDLIGRRDASLFRKHFGEDRFAFRLGPCQFLLVNNCVNGLSEADYAWIRAESSPGGPGEAVRHRFLFLHYPPLEAPKRVDAVREKPSYRRLYELAPALAIRRVFSGNLHAYRRLEVHGVPYVVCGGGGGTLQSPEAFHHYVEVTVDGDAIREEIVRLPTIRSPLEEIDRFAFVYVWPRLRDRPWAEGLLAVAVAALVGWQGWRAKRWIEGRR